MTDRIHTSHSGHASQDASPGLPSFWNWRRFLPVALLMVLGISFFVTLFYLVRVYEKESRRDIFQKVADARILAFERRAQSDVAAILSIGYFFAASQDVNQKEFSIFVNGPLNWHPEIQSLEWVPRIPAEERASFEAQHHLTILEENPDGDLIPAGDRPEYFPILFQETLRQTETTLGFDLGSIPANRMAMRYAITNANGKPSSTGSIFNYFGATNAPVPGLRLFLPIYLKINDSHVSPYQPTNLMGFAAALLRPMAMLRQSQSSDHSGKLDICIFELTSPDSATLLDFESPDPSFVPPRTIPARVDPDDPSQSPSSEPFSLRKEIPIAGRTWILLCKPSLGFIGSKDWEGWSVLLGGLLLTVLLSSYLYTILGQTAYIENVVTRRTRDLASLNVRLQNEIGERERGERALRDSEALYHSLVDSVPMNILRKNLQGQITFGNKRYCETFGQPLEKMLGKTDFDFFPQKMAEKYVADDHKVVRTGKIFEDIEEHRNPDGTLCYMHILKGPVSDANGNIVGTQVIFWDVTEKKQSEESLKQTLADLARSNQDLEQFAYVASHDLQEPLRMIASFTELLARRYKGQLDGEAQEFIQYAIEGAVRMKALINDLLTYSRLDTRGTPFTATSCSKALAESLKNLQIAIDESRALITQDPLPTVLGDGIQLTQVFQNLISNAIKFHGPNSPQIQIKVKKIGQEWQFSVADNGIGIDQEHRERIFVIFQRLHSRERYPGTGIGLAICKKIVERHGGRIWMDSKPGQGTTFYFTLPVMPSNSDNSSTS